MVSFLFNVFIARFCSYFYFVFCSLCTANIYFAVNTQSILPLRILLATTETCCKTVQIYTIYTFELSSKRCSPILHTYMAAYCCFFTASLHMLEKLSPPLEGELVQRPALCLKCSTMPAVLRSSTAVLVIKLLQQH